MTEKKLDNNKPKTSPIFKYANKIGKLTIKVT